MPTPFAADTFASWHQTTWKLHTEQILWHRNGITHSSRTFTLTNTATQTDDTDLMTKKYFPNNWTRLVKVPHQYFESLPFDAFMDWKMNGWEIAGSHECIIRTINCETGKVKEYVYQRKDAARRRMLKLLQEEKHEIVICTHDNIQHLKPEKYISEHDEDTFYSQ